MVTLLVYGYLIPKHELESENLMMLQAKGATIISKPMHYIVGAVLRAYIIDAIKVSDLSSLTLHSNYKWKLSGRSEELFLVNVKDDEIDEIKFE